MPVNRTRERLGRLLAKEHPVEADIVTPVPDSGVPAAIGYSADSGIPFRMALIRNHYIGRTFIEPEQAIRDFGVKLKLNPVRRMLEGQRVVLVDDSIVRGTTSRKIVRLVRDAGATEVHVRDQLPADDFALLLRRGYAAARGIDRRANIPSKKYANILGADSLGYRFARRIAAGGGGYGRRQPQVLHVVLHRQLSDGAGATGSGGSS